MADALRRLVDHVRAQGGLPPHALVDPTGHLAAHGARAGSGPAAAGRREDYELLVEAIREGYLLHYHRGRVVAPDDGDLALLAGDQLYALGLAQLAALGDLDAVIELADVISLCAQAHAAGRPELAGPIWDAGVAAVGWGAESGHARAKALASQAASDADDAPDPATRWGDRPSLRGPASKTPS